MVGGGIGAFIGGVHRMAAALDGEIDLVGWSPDGRKLLCTIRKTDTEELEREKDEQKKKLEDEAKRRAEEEAKKAILNKAPPAVQKQAEDLKKKLFGR